MGNKFWGVDIQAVVGSAIKPTDMPNFTLRKLTIGVREPGTLAGGTNNGPPSDYTCHGLISDYRQDEILDSPLVIKGDKKVVLIAKPLADAGVKPEPEDTLIDGEKEYTIITVGGNSAEAVWICQCRG